MFPPITCPKCGTQIGWDRVSFHVQFLCPRCLSGLHLRDSYPRVLNVVAVVVTGLVFYGLGARGDLLFWLVFLGWLPIAAVIQSINLSLFPPDVELTGEFRGILYGQPGASNAVSDDVDETDSKG